MLRLAMVICTLLLGTIAIVAVVAAEKWREMFQELKEYQEGKKDDV